MKQTKQQYKVFKYLTFIAQEDCTTVRCLRLVDLSGWLKWIKTLNGSKSSKAPDFVNEILLEQKHAQAFTYCNGCFPTTMTELNRDSVALKT